MKIVKNEDAVSPVIGVILMVAITVILAAVIAAFVFNIGGTQTKTPVASLAATTSNSGDSINITHRGGDTIDLLNTKAIIEQGSSRMEVATLKSTTQTFAVGDEIGIWVNSAAAVGTAVTMNKTALTSGTVTGKFDLTTGTVTVTLIDTVSSQQIAYIKSNVN